MFYFSPLPVESQGFPVARPHMAARRRTGSTDSLKIAVKREAAEPTASECTVVPCAPASATQKKAKKTKTISRFLTSRGVSKSNKNGSRSNPEVMSAEKDRPILTRTNSKSVSKSNFESRSNNGTNNGSRSNHEVMSAEKDRPILTRTNSFKPKLCPRREFGPAQDHFPTRQSSLRNTNHASGTRAPRLGQNRAKTTSPLVLCRKPRVQVDVLEEVLRCKVKTRPYLR